MSIRRFSPATLLVALVAAVAVSVPAEGETLLHWKYEVGQKNHLIMTQDMQMKMVIKDQTVLTTATWTMDLLWEVTAVDDQGVATMTETVTRIRMKIQGPQGVMMEYDSDSGEKPQGMAAMFAPMFDSMVNKPFVARMDPRGKVVEMTIPQGLAESMAKLPGGGQLGNALSEEGLKDMAEIVTFPETPVSPGDTWTCEASMKNPVAGNANVETTLRYVGPETRDGRELERIDLEMKFQFDEGEKAAIKVTDQSGSGTIYFDNALGRFTTSEGKMTMKMQISVMGQEMQQEMEVNTSAVCTPVEPSEKNGK
ncbi:MAG: hypothetical protein GXX96_39400 [Planctomycetaceae bacterium]|nr:hypothetical protein [Planctomycetaceae bacterium]